MGQKTCTRERKREFFRTNQLREELKQMRKIICIANQKGGVGKTTTAVNLAASLAVAEKQTLLIDIDPQGNASSGVGLNKDEIKENIYHALMEEKDVEDVIKKTELTFLDVLPSNIDLTGAEIELVNLPSRELKLCKIIQKVENKYDYILIDCPPSLGLLTLNSLAAADSILMPVQCEYYALEGLSRLLRTVQLVKKRLNPRLEIEGLLLTMFDNRNNLCQQVVEEVKTHFKDKVFNVMIPRNVKLAECPSFGKPILIYDINCKGARSYLQLAEEIMNNGRTGR
jgi:chromosome partitioning protein